jgi:alanyl-tRNA synthetase
MKTEKLYYKDPRQCEFEARILSAEKEKKRWKVVLDRTCFYPEGGGQPADRGTLNGVPVIDVQKSGEEIIHYTGENPGADSGGAVRGIIDWDYRFEYMQQHTGQHIISACLFAAGPYHTTAVHQGEEFTTVECDADEIAGETLERIEDEANRIVCANLPVETVFTDDKGLNEFSLRREAKVSGEIRIVHIADADTVACGGIHTEHTGEVGLIKYTASEQIRGNTRLYWKIGRRAYHDYREKTRICSALIDQFSARQHEIIDRSRHMEENLLQARNDIRSLKEELCALEAERLRAGTAAEKKPVITRLYTEKDKDFLRSLCDALRSQEPEAALCLCNEAGGRLQWCIGMPENSSFDFNRVRHELLEAIDGKGGGKAPVWQGIGNNTKGSADFFSRFKKLLSQ